MLSAKTVTRLVPTLRDPTPSPEDLHLSAEVFALACKLGVDLLDHLVIGEGVYFSMKENGVGLGGEDAANSGGE